MKYLKIYEELLGCKNEDEVFQFMIKNLKPSNILWSYFVNWEKVYSNVRKYEICLNLLNYLIGKDDFDEEFKKLIKAHPQIIEILPTLAVERDKKFDILVDFQNKNLKYEHYDFSIKNPSLEDIEKYLHFVKEAGLKDLICNNKIKSLVDYMIGIEAGMDSNGRKNRCGCYMEDIVEVFIKDLCSKKNYKYLKKANSEKILEEFNIFVPVQKSSRRYNYVVKAEEEIVIFEVNFYNDSGSKLKSTAGEYRNLYDVLDNKFKFIWITDGLGWLKAQHPLRETFEHNDFIVSLTMLEKGVLEKIV